MHISDEVFAKRISLSEEVLGVVSKVCVSKVFEVEEVEELFHSDGNFETLNVQLNQNLDYFRLNPSNNTQLPINAQPDLIQPKTYTPLALSTSEEETVQRALSVAKLFSTITRNKHSKKSSTNTELTDVCIREVLNEAMAAAAESFGIRAAQEWAEGFLFPEDCRTQDAILFQANNLNFDDFIQAKRAPTASDRLSVQRVQQWVDINALTNKDDYQRLLDIAKGIIIQEPIGFEPLATLPKQRKKYTNLVSHAVNKLLHKQWLEGTVVILPTELVRLIAGIHFSVIHWTTKAGKECGRALGDVAHALVGIPLNGADGLGKEQLRASMERTWGKIEHPTVSDIALMIWAACEKWGAHNCILWKLDLKGAFNLMNFLPESAKRLAFELTEGLSVIHTTGMFGWTGTPYCFQVITRVLRDTCRQMLVGNSTWYVDDCIAISPIPDADNDVEVASTICRNLLGPAAVAEDKYEKARRLVGIGWTFDLNTLTVAISRRNMLKCIYIFFCFDYNKPVSLLTVERLASLAARYAMLCRQMKPFSAAIFSCISQYNGNNHSMRVLSPHARTDVVLWRSFLCLLHFDESNYARPFASFVKRAPSVLIEYDASLTGFGVGVSEWCSDSETWVLQAYTRLVAPYEVTNDSSNQNTHEFMGIMLGLLLVLQTGTIQPGFAFNVIGDSASSLSWCLHERVCSLLARRADVGFSLLSVELDATVCEVEHIPGIYNTIYDGLSRGKEGFEVGLPMEKYIPLNLGSFATKFMRLCNPNIPLVTAEEHNNFAIALLDLIKNKHIF